MKKYFNLFALALVALFFTTACSNDDDPAPVPQKKVVKEYSESFVNENGSLDTYLTSTLNYLDGVFSTLTIAENYGDFVEQYTYSLKGDKILDEKGKAVCQDMKFNADGLLTYVNSIYGKFTLTYSGRHIVNCVCVIDDWDDGVSVTNESRLNWEGGKLVSIETIRTMGNEKETTRTRYTYSSVPSQHKQMVHSAMPILGNLSTAVPGIEALGILGDGADYAVTGFTETVEGKDEEAHTITLTFDADGYLTSEKDDSRNQFGIKSHCISYKY